ncbi:MAG: YraN family protein [Phycisphaerae bacterium]|jgi:putative endonuclease|nr:YraN family protein [Phycisphaerae bacterium]
MPKRQARACLPEKATLGHAPHSTREYGDKGERLAETYLKRRGLKLVARGFVTPVGEIDLIVRDGDTVVFVEVKTRRSRQFADPQESVGAVKQRKMRRCAEWFLRQRNWTDRPCRFDVIGIVLPDEGEPEIEHFADAFQPKY